VADEAAAMSLRELVERARDLGLASVAVGVEDDATYRLVSSYGYDLAQGFWMSRPLAARDVSRWRGWMARIALGGAAAFVAPFGFARIALGPSAGPTASPVDVERGSQCCSRAMAGEPVDLGLTMATTSVDGARVVAEASVPADDVARISAAIARDLGWTERAFGASFDRAPTVYVLATRASFAYAVQRGFGQSATDAGVLAASNGGVAFPRQGAVVLNWEAARADRSLAIVRHELTHVLAHQLAGFETVLPAWFDEGLATLAERQVASDPLEDARSVSTTLTLLAQGRGSLTMLSSPRDWTLRNAELEGRGYALAGHAVELLAGGGMEGMRDLLERASTAGFAEAFAAWRGESVADFAAAFPARFATDQSSLFIAHRPDGGSVRWTVSGARPDTTMKVTIDGHDYHVEFDARADRDGVYSAVFGGTAKAGDYTITVLGRDGVRASTVVRVS
jgi:hypothetical protein